MKIKFKLSIMMTVIMALAIAGLSILELFEARNISLDLSLRGLEAIVQNQASVLEGLEENNIMILRTLANIMGAYENLPPESRRDFFDDFLENVIKRVPNVISIYTIWKPNALDNMDSYFINRTGSTPTGQYAMEITREGSGLHFSYAANDLNNAMSYLTGPSANRDRIENPVFREIAGTRQLVYKIMVPIVNPATNETVGGVGLVLDISGFQPMLEETISNNEIITLMILYSNNGTIMAHFIPERIGRVMTEVDMEHGNNMQAALLAVNRGESFFAKTYDPTLRTTVEYYIKPIRVGNSDHYWAIVIGTADAIIYKEANDLTLFIIFLGITVILIAAIIVFLVLHYMTKPIVDVANNLKDIAQGEGDLTQSIMVKSKDEIGDLASYFNQTLQKIKALIISIKKQTVSLSDIGTDLTSNMTETAAAINQITSNIQSIKGRIINQSASVTETNATMEQITNNINRLNDHVENQSKNISMASSAVEEMAANIQSVNQSLINNADNVRELMDTSDEGRTGLSEVAGDIKEISKESEALLEINSVMQNIASQTNLLSMNAAIEAAHAGDLGKGFAVVADEIRKLAEDSSQQSKTISIVLKKIKSSIDKITISTESVLEKFESIDSCVKVVAEHEGNIRHAMEEQDTGSRQLLEGVANVNEITRHVKSGSEEMFIGSREVIKEGKNLENMTQEITRGMNEMASGAEQINTAVHMVNELSNKTRENINILANEVSRFKVE